MYNSIPQNTKKIYLEIWSCGPECCGAAHFNIWANVPGHVMRYELWSSSTIFYEDHDKDEIQDLREEVIEAAAHYGIELIDIDDDCIWDWEGERTL